MLLLLGTTMTDDALALLWTAVNAATFCCDCKVCRSSTSGSKREMMGLEEIVVD
jgi:hypothetical protein